MHWLSPVFYVKAKFGPLEKKNKNNDWLHRGEIFQKNSRVHTFLTTKVTKTFWESWK